MCGNGLPIGQGAEFGIGAAAGLLRFLHHLAVELLAALQQGVVFIGCGLEFAADAVVALPVPVGAEVLAEVLDRVDVIVSEQHVVADGVGSHLSEIVDIGQGYGLLEHVFSPNARSTFGQGSRGGECLLRGVVVGQGEFSLAGRGGEVEVSPVDADVVALLAEDLLLDGSRAQILHTLFAAGFGDDGLARIVDGQLGCGFEVELYVVTGLIDGTDLPREVVHRTREQLQIIHQQRGGEDHLDLDASAEERVDGPCGENADGFLFGHQPESLVGALAEEPEIDIGSADRVVAVSGDGYFAGFERGGGFGREGLADVALPDVAGVGHLDTVDIEFEDVVVRIFEDELLGREIPVEFKGAADPDVAVFALPFGCRFSASAIRRLRVRSATRSHRKQATSTPRRVCGR